MQVQTLNNTATLQTHTQNTKKATNELSSGKKDLSLDPAMMMIAQALLSDATVFSQGIQNANESVAMLQIADGTMQNISQSTADLAALNVRYNSAALNSDQKAMLSQEFSAQVSAIDDMMQSSSYNGMSLFGKSVTTSLGDATLSTTIPSLDTSTLEIGNSDALEAFTKALTMAQSEVGSGINALSSATKNLFTQKSTTLSSYSQIADADIAQSVSDLQKSDLLMQSATLAQANSNKLDTNRVLALLA